MLHCLPDADKDPFVFVIAGRRGSGKTTLCIRLLISDCAYKGKFDKIILVSETAQLSGQWSRNIDTSDWQVHDHYSPKIIDDLMEKQTGTKPANREHILLILDDLGHSTRRGLKMSDVDPLDTLASNGRHLCISIIFLCQQLSQTCTSIRANADAYICFAAHSLRDSLALRNETAGEIPWRAFHDKILETTKERHSFVLIRVTGGRVEHYANLGRKITF